MQVSHRIHTKVPQTGDIRKFWCTGYFVSTVGKNEKKIAEYVRNQLKEDYVQDQMCIKEYIDPFTGEPVGKSK